MPKRLLRPKIKLLTFLILFTLLGSSKSASAGVLSVKGEVFDSDGLIALPGDGLSGSGDDGYVQLIDAGPDGMINPPDADGSPTGDDALLETAEYPGQLFTVIGEGFPFSSDGRFFEDFSHALHVGSKVYCRAWNETSPETSTHYGDSGLYSIADAQFDTYDFGSWSTDLLISKAHPKKKKKRRQSEPDGGEMERTGN
jgi:hypothetical protein